MTLSRSELLRLSGLSWAAAVARRAMGAVQRTRWGMAVDTAKCLAKPDCNQCIEACHRTHNVPAIPERRHDVRWIWKEPFEHAFRSQVGEFSPLRQAPVMVFCNHCENPPCVRVCPTQATWKREDGIVAMDWHRCIGCRYCMAACPYGSRSFNWRDPGPFLRNANRDYPARTKGVVEKCTFCSERIAEGKKPVCTEVCPEKALVFGNLADPESEIRKVLASRSYIRRKPELGAGPDVFYIV